MTVLIFIIILVILILIHEFGHFIIAKKNGVYVEEFGIGFPPRIWGKKVGETLYSINAIPLGGFVKLYGEEYHETDKNAQKKKKEDIPKHRAFINKKPWQKALIITGGVIMNFILGWVIISYLFTTGVDTPDGVSIEEVQENTPAAMAGLQPDDKLIKIEHDGETIEISTTYQLIQATQKFSGDEVDLTVERNGNIKTVTLLARENPPQDQGSFGIVINQEVQKITYPWYTAPFYGLGKAYSTTKLIVTEIAKIPAQLITQQKTDVQFSGPVGIAQVVGQAREYGINALLEITAILSLNLAVINILPLPALDGGRLMFIAYEWVTRKQPNQNLERNMNFIGIVLLLTLAAVITVYDIIRIF